MKKIIAAVIISIITLADLCGQEKAIEYEGHVSAYISYPSPGFGDWQNPGCGLMTTHGVRFNSLTFSSPGFPYRHSPWGCSPSTISWTGRGRSSSFCARAATS